MLRSVLVMVVLVVASTGCNRSITLVEPEKEIITDTLTGTVPAPVDGVLQSVSRTFVVGQGGGAVSVTLTSAVQTLPDGTEQTTVTMGIGVGNLVDSVCIVPSTAFTTTPAGSSPHLVGTLDEGTYCVQVSDVTTQEGPVAFTVKVEHT